MTSQYHRGRRKEYAVCKQLRSDGYLAQRTAGSHGLFDVMAVSPTTIKLIQVKYIDSRSSWRDANTIKLQKLPVPPGTTKEVWVYRKGTKDPTDIYTFVD